jgi:hypothetical protein
VPYARQTMRSEEARYSVPSGRFLLVLVVAGGVVGSVLLLLRAPFWLFYIAPVSMAPLIIWELRSLDEGGFPVEKAGDDGTAGASAGEGQRPNAARRLWLSREPEYASRAVSPFLVICVLALLLFIAVGAIAVATAGDGRTVLEVAGSLGGLVAAFWLVRQAFTVVTDLRLQRFETRTAVLRADRQEQVEKQTRAEYEETWNELGIDHEEMREVPGVVVIPDGSAWVVHIADELESLGSYGSRSQALDAASRYLMNRGGGELVTLDKHGHVEHETVLSSQLPKRRSIPNRRELGLSADEPYAGAFDVDAVRDRTEDLEEAMVQRIVALGFEIRVELVLGDGTEVWAQMTRGELQQLELREGQIVYLRPVHAKSPGPPPSGEGLEGADPGDENTERFLGRRGDSKS